MILAVSIIKYILFVAFIVLIVGGAVELYVKSLREYKAYKASFPNHGHLTSLLIGLFFPTLLIFMAAGMIYYFIFD